MTLPLLMLVVPQRVSCAIQLGKVEKKQKKNIKLAISFTYAFLNISWYLVVNYQDVTNTLAQFKRNEGTVTCTLLFNKKIYLCCR